MFAGSGAPSQGAWISALGALMNSSTITAVSSRKSRATINFQTTQGSTTTLTTTERHFSRLPRGILIP